ncbi:MAG TPA: hypothetical protein VLJ86_04775, partial [Ramlibacter sp.]|nr:hypothetical protein [Ramlibacter sp.]
MVQRAIDQVSSYFRSGSAAPAQPTARPARNAEQQPASAPRTAGAGITAALRNLFDRLFSVATPNAPRLSAAPTVRDTPELAAAQINVPGAMEPHLYEAELSAYAGKLDKACAAMASGDPAKALAILKGARSDLAALGVACEAAGGNLSNGELSGLAMKQLAPSLAPAKLYALKVIVDTVGKELQGALASALGAAMDKAPPDAVQCRELRESASDLAAFTQSMDGMAVKITGGTSEVARNARSSAASLLKSLGQNAKALLGST